MSHLDLIDWDAPGPYRVAFSTRIGGVSEGPFAALNLGILTEDDPARVVENRSLLCDAVGADANEATMAWQRHGANVTRADARGIVTPGTVYDHCDGLWSDEPGRAMLLLTADCMPIALVRSNGDPPAAAILHAGWRGLLAGIIGSGVRALASRRLVAAIGPSIGPCCYQVDSRVRNTFLAATPDAAAWFTEDGPGFWRLDLWQANVDLLEAAGVPAANIHVARFCTRDHPETCFSYRGEGPKTGRLVAAIRLTPSGA